MSSRRADATKSGNPQPSKLGVKLTQPQALPRRGSCTRRVSAECSFPVFHDAVEGAKRFGRKLETSLRSFSALLGQELTACAGMKEF